MAESKLHQAASSTSALSAALLWFCFWFGCLLPTALPANVTYDSRSLVIDGQRKLLISASIHYPRSVPAMWPGLVAAAKEGGADAIETYVFWNGHEPSPGKYYFEDRFDLVKFVKTVQGAGMYMILRIGPFVAAEWIFGGVPVWLHYVPGTVFRSDSEPWKVHMKGFTTLIVNLLKREKLFASQGGPIILAQVENEYGDIERIYGEGGKRYAMWAADMALSQDIGVPWIMCQQYDAPDHVINTCNSFYCDQFIPNSVNKPKIWTENWPGWFKTFGGRNPHRPPEDIAYAVARFFGKGGSLQNYYMYHGGTNFGRTSGGPFITTSYDYDAPIDEYGLVRLPNWGHLKELHKALKLCEHALLYGEPTLVSLGPLQEADVYRDSSGRCAAFIANKDEANDKLVIFQNKTYHVPAWSVSILPDCKNVAFNTAKVGSQTSIVEMIPESIKALQWDSFVEKPGIWGKEDLVKRGFLDHINTTKDSTDYLWYTTKLHFDGSGLLSNAAYPILVVESKGHGVHVFINQELQVSGYGNGANSSFKVETPILLKPGNNEIALLSMTVGLQNAGPFYEWVGAGPTTVKIYGLRNGTMDLSSNTWIYKIGLQGEHQHIYQEVPLNNINWISESELPKNQPLTWYKAAIDPPHGNDPIGLDMAHMGKGQAWLNGKAIGRYWPRTSSMSDECPNTCNYRGKFYPDKCNSGCGEPTQRWYHVPRSWFRPLGNTLVIFEERGGDPTKISFSRRLVTGICSFVQEDYPSMDFESQDKSVNVDGDAKATLSLKCPGGTMISNIRFASFGTPSGRCGSYLQGDCHYSNSISVVQQACLNKSECFVALTEKSFGGNLCSGVAKALAVEAACS
uniref:Beta-galactosidase n=3 Tax=Anthurium amnicola TaxID=1678845 RepID=A0A1D1Y0M8_9ARAE